METQLSWLARATAVFFHLVVRGSTSQSTNIGREVIWPSVPGELACSSIEKGKSWGVPSGSPPRVSPRSERVSSWYLPYGALIDVCKSYRTHVALTTCFHSHLPTTILLVPCRSATQGVGSIDTSTQKHSLKTFSDARILDPNRSRLQVHALKRISPVTQVRRSHLTVKRPPVPSCHISTSVAMHLETAAALSAFSSQLYA